MTRRIVAGLVLAGLVVGCAHRASEAYGETYVATYGGSMDHALLEKRLTDRINAAELHLSQRLERIEQRIGGTK